MCKLIADLVSADKQVLHEMIHRLEMASGGPGIDVRLTGEIYGKLHMKMRELGLDPNDTTPHELYQALQNLAALHDTFIARKLGINKPNDSADVLPAVVAFANSMKIPKQTWALKQVAAKKMLKAMPPKTLMKLLNYRSVDSLLKREPIGIVLTVARHIEPAAWQQKFIQTYKHLKPNAFEAKNIEIVYLEQQRWQVVGQTYLFQKHTPLLHSAETGSIAVLPLPSQALTGLTLTSLLLILHYINEIRTYGTYFKFHHMQADFGKFLVHTISQNSPNHIRLGGQPIHWRIVHRYYGKNERLNHPEIFEPHVQPEDLAYRKAEELLYRLEPALHFWHDLDYVGLPQPEGGPLSFNLADTLLNVLNCIPYEKRINYHLQESLWNELYIRYLGQRSLEADLLQQLDEQVIETDSARDMELAW